MGHARPKGDHLDSAVRMRASRGPARVQPCPQPRQRVVLSHPHDDLTANVSSGLPGAILAHSGRLRRTRVQGYLARSDLPIVEHHSRQNVLAGNRSGAMATGKQLILSRRAAKRPRKKRMRPEPRQYTMADLERARDRAAAAERRIDNDPTSNSRRGRAGLKRAQLELSVIESQLRSRGLVE